MKHRSLRRMMGIIAVGGLLLAACGDPDEDENGAGNGDGAAADFKACQVTDEGGVEDKSFNATAYAGLERAEAELGVEQTFLESNVEEDYVTNIETFLEDDCDLIVTVGFALGDATLAAAQENEDQNFAIVDFDFFDFDANQDIEAPNARELTFDTDEAAFLAGYLAAGMTETQKVGTYGGQPFPTVTIFMEGFEAGIDYYNAQKGTQVDLIGWTSATGEGSFTGNFTDTTLGRQTTDTLLDDGADIIMPVAGPVGQGSIEAIRARSGSTAKLIWVDTDGCVSVESACDLFLTSVEKKMDNAVFDTIQAAVNGEFEGGLYIGTLENDGVGISEYHEFEDDIPQELKDEIEELRVQIIAGEIETRPAG